MKITEKQNKNKKKMRKYTKMRGETIKMGKTKEKEGKHSEKR